MASLWLEEPAEPLPRPAVPAEPEVEIVGGGVTGCACALVLAEAGVRVRLHDAREIAGGASGRNGGFALRGGAMSYDAARRTLGHDRAREYWRLTERALEKLESLGGDAFRRVGSLRLAVDENERADLRAEYEALVEDGFAATWLEPHELDPVLGRRYAAAVLHPPDGSLQPARWVRRLAARAAAAGADVRERSPVASLDELKAERVVVATDGYTDSLVPELRGAIRPTRGQVLVTEPLPELVFPRPHYARWGYDYWQQTPDRRLVLGGSRDAGRDAEWTSEERTTATVQERLEGLVAELVGHVPRITHRWAGIWGTTDDRLPLVGRVAGSERERVWVAAGYSGHGNVLGLACGELVARALIGRHDALLDALDPGR